MTLFSTFMSLAVVSNSVYAFLFFLLVDQLMHRSLLGDVNNIGLY